MPRLAALVGCCVLALCACDGRTAHDPRGAACSADGDCGALRCVAEIPAKPKDLAALPLRCGDARAAGKQGQACQDARDCARNVCLLAGACAAPCAHDGDCGKGEQCQAVFARASTDALQTLTACVAAVSLPKSAASTREVRPHALTVGTSEVELAAAETQGTTLYVLEHMQGVWPGTVCRPPLCMQSLRTTDDPPVELWSSSADYRSGPPPRNPVATSDQIDPAVILLPSGTRDALSSSGYVAEVVAEQRGDLRVTRLSRTDTGQRLDLNVFYLGGLDWQPEGARGPALLTDALDQVDQILAQADIFIGDVRQIAVPGGLPARGIAFPDGDSAQGFEVLQLRYGVYMELPGLFRLSAGAADSAVNLFFVKDIQPRPNDGEPEAESGGIPGPLGMHGTASSGIAIATDMMAGDPQRLAKTLAHEIGHYLGLFHTSESDGSVLDALADTPECRSDRDLDHNGLDVADCQGYGADNLMFWAKTTGTVLTAEQQAVLRSALVLQ
ncbi:MAG: M43 family zinc metalloprotease [Polyangiales bacterium]